MDVAQFEKLGIDLKRKQEIAVDEFLVSLKGGILPQEEHDPVVSTDQLQCCDESEMNYSSKSRIYIYICWIYNQ